MQMTGAYKRKRSGKTRPTLGSTIAAVRNPGVSVELEPGGVSGGGNEIIKSS